METIWGTSVAIDGLAVLIRGPSGAGKSDLALRLIDGGALLISDDQTEFSRESNRLVARAPDSIRGRLEVRGIGIVSVPTAARAPLVLVVDLVPPEQVDRMPNPGRWRQDGVEVPLIVLAAFEASAAAKLRLAVRRVVSE
jgi:serine kinase of HPr protein (carbohydrate metabolism regulator)